MRPSTLAALALTALLALPLTAREPVEEPAPETAPESTVAQPDGLVPNRDNPLAALAPFVGRTWRGTFAGATEEQPMEDVARWEWALSGRAIRVSHSLNGGAYGGETLLMEDPEGDGLVFYYFTTADFYTRGSSEIENGKLVSEETVVGDAGGVTALRSVAELLSDGRLRVTSRHRRDGVWEDGPTVIYAEDPTARVVFHDPE